MGYKRYSTHKETPSRFFDKGMVSTFKENQSSSLVVPKNESILINTINETDKETNNDTSIGFTQQTDAKKRKGNTGGFFEKNSPSPP